MPDSVTRLNAALSGRYRVERQLGEGGMATVYLADDLRHSRKVAFKVLRPELAAVVGAERFLAEIRTTASLQHPHILPLHDSGDAEGLLYYVMPHVEGESLRDRLNREHQLPVDEAVRIATNVAEALDYAHRHGVIHRDIKPANILLQDSKPLVSDFGIALAVQQAGGAGPRLTETGLSLGTPHYMSPEQATGDARVGPASDVWSLGCVLYEMLVGEPPYTGSTPQAVLGKIITAEPAPASEARKLVPASVDATIRKALEKVPSDRFTSAREFARGLADPGFRHGVEIPSGIASGAVHWNWLSITSTVLALAFALGFSWLFLRRDATLQVARFPSPFEDGQAPIGPVEFTANGNALVYVGPGESGQGTQLWVRTWSDLVSTPIRGTEGANNFVLSPDGREVAFSAYPGALRVTPLDGGAGRTLLDESAGTPSDWTADGNIYFSRAADATGVASGVLRVPATGRGEGVEVLTERLEGETLHRYLRVLPGGAMGIFQVWRLLTGQDAEIWAIDLETRERRFLTAGHTPMYAPTGHLLFVTADGTLMAAAINSRTAELTGSPAAVAENIAVVTVNSVSWYDVAENGALVYMSGSGSTDQTPVWVSRDGSEQALAANLTGLFEAPSISPDGRKVALQRQVVGQPEDIWIYDLDQETFDRLTFGEGRNLQPFWSPDGSQVGFSSNRDGLFALYSRSANFEGEARLLASDPNDGLYEGSWGRGGELVYRRGSTTTTGNRDLLYSPPGVGNAPVTLVATPYPEYGPALSPDGRWLAYTSDQSGQPEVYVRSFPRAGGQTVVSAGGGRHPVWAASGRELFFLAPNGSLTAAAVRSDPVFTVESREQLMSWPYLNVSETRDYDLSPDDRRFLAVGDFNVGGWILVQNFLEELERTVPE